MVMPVVVPPAVMVAAVPAEMAAVMAVPAMTPAMAPAVPRLDRSRGERQRQGGGAENGDNQIAHHVPPLLAAFTCCVHLPRLSFILSPGENSDAPCVTFLPAERASCISWPGESFAAPPGGADR